jgi:hypothetical protein
MILHVFSGGNGKVPEAITLKSFVSALHSTAISHIPDISSRWPEHHHRLPTAYSYPQKPFCVGSVFGSGPTAADLVRKALWHPGGLVALVGGTDSPGAGALAAPQ